MEGLTLIKNLLSLLIIAVLNSMSLLVKLIVTSLRTFVANMLANDTLVSGIISGAGSFFGGIIGAGVAALVAFKVAKKQLDADKNKEINQFKLKCRNYLILLIHEIEHNKHIYELLEKDKEVSKSTVFETGVWEKIRFEANAFLTIRQYDVLEEIYREMRDIQSNRINDYDNDFFEISLDTLSKVKDNLSIVLEKVDSNLKEQDYL